MRRVLVVSLILIASCSRSDTEAPTPVETRMVRDAATGAELPRLVLPDRPAVEARVNASLDSLSASLACEDGTPFDVRASVAVAEWDVLSVSVHASYFCGGPYPTNDANLSETFDLTTGQRVPFQALWRDDRADRGALSGVLSATLAPPAIAADEACADLVTAEALESAAFAYALTPDDLLVQPEFPHAVEACAAEALVPYASVRAFAAPGGVLERASAQD